MIKTNDKKAIDCSKNNLSKFFITSIIIYGVIINAVESVQLEPRSSRRTRNHERIATPDCWTRHASISPKFITGHTSPKAASINGTLFSHDSASADVWLAAFLQVHDKMDRGIYGCSKDKVTDGVLVYQALKWAINIINQDQGEINGIPVSQSLIPGVKLGVKVFDSCGHDEMARHQLSSMIQNSESSICSHAPHSDNYDPWAASNERGDKYDVDSILPLGIIDTVGLANDGQVAETLMSAIVPILPMMTSSIVPSETIASMLAQILEDLNWKKIAILHAQDENSIHIVKEISHFASSGKFCLKLVEHLPKATEVQLFMSKKFKHLTRNLDLDTPIFVVGQGPHTDQLIESLVPNERIASKFQWFFVSLPRPSVLKHLRSSPILTRILTLSPFPGQMSAYDPLSNSQEIIKDEWDSDNQTSSIEPIDALWRTYVELPTIHSIYTFAHAIRNAWITHCEGRAGLCHQLRSMNRGQFVANFLEPLEFEHNVQLRSPYSLVSGRKRLQTRPGEIENLRLTITKFKVESHADHHPNANDVNHGIIDFMQYIVYNGSHSGPGQIVDPNQPLVVTPMPCEGTECDECAKIRQSRGGHAEDYYDPFDELVSSESDPSDTVFRIKTEGSGEDDDDEHHSHHQITIPLVLPIHKHGKNPLECSEEINPAAIFDLEAALWIIDKVHDDPHFVPGVAFDVVVVDSCSSSLKALHRLSQFLNDANNHEVGSINFEQVLGIVTSLSPEETKPVTEIVEPMNVSLISAQDVSPSRITANPIRGLFQTAIPFDQFVEAVIEQLKYFGWKFVSIVKTNDLKSDATLDQVTHLAKENGICISTIETLHDDHLVESAEQALMNLREAKHSGAKIVLLLTNQEASDAILTAQKRLAAANIVNRNEFLWILVGDGHANLHSVNGFEPELLGSLLLREGQNSITAFQEYFDKLRPTTNTRNQWFKTLYKQITASCEKTIINGGSASTSDACFMYHLGHHVNPTTAVNTMQAVLHLITAFARLRIEVCGHDAPPGLCPKMISLKPIDFRPRLNYALANTASLKAETLNPDTKDVFSFTAEGFSNRKIEILNFKTDPKSAPFYRFDKVATFAPPNLQLNPNTFYSAYNESGSEIQMNKIRSECEDFQMCVSKCSASKPELLLFDSPEQLYIVATFDVHQRSPTSPFLCGQISSKGIQNLEAFMWALDAINNNKKILPGVTLGTLILDTCSSHQKAARDAANFLSNSLASKGGHVEIPAPGNAIGFMTVSDDDRVTDAILEATQPLHLTTLAAGTFSTMYNPSHSPAPSSWSRAGGVQIVTSQYPQLLRLNTDNSVIGDAVASILLKFNWNLVSLIYGDDGQSLNLREQIMAKLDILGSKIRVDEKLGRELAVFPQAIQQIIGKLVEGSKEGARVVIVLLPQYQTIQLMTYLERLLKDGHQRSLQLGQLQFLFVSVGDDAKSGLYAAPLASLGALAIEEAASSSTLLRQFKTYFANINLRNNSRNPWFHEFWEEQFHCRGSACFETSTDPQYKISPDSFDWSPKIASTLHGVFTVAAGLEAARKSLCPSHSRGVCPQFSQLIKSLSNNAPSSSQSGPLLQSATSSSTIFHFIKQSSYQMADGHLIKYSQSGNYLMTPLSILNFKHIQWPSNRVKFHQIGMFEEEDGLVLNMTAATSYNERAEPISMKIVSSACLDDRLCGQSSSFMPSAPNAGLGSNIPASAMQILPGQEPGLSIGALMPIHGQGSSIFTCGSLAHETAFQNLVAFEYALDEVNSNRTIIGEVPSRGRLGGLVIDYCGRKERAEERLYTFFSNAGQNSMGAGGLETIRVSPKSVIAFITYADDVSHEVDHLLDINKIFHVTVPSIVKTSKALQTAHSDVKSIRSVPKRETQLQAIADLLAELKIKYINLIYGDDDERTLFMNKLRPAGICIAEQIPISHDQPISFVKEVLTDKLKVSQDPSATPNEAIADVIVILGNEPLSSLVLSAAPPQLLSQHYLWVGSQELLESERNSSYSATALPTPKNVMVLKVESYANEKFRRFMASTSPLLRGAIPKPWYEEFWQMHFECQLPTSSSPLTQYKTMCSLENQRLTPITIIEDDYVYHTITIVNKLAEGLANFLRKEHCGPISSLRSIEDCGSHALGDSSNIREKLNKELRRSLLDDEDHEDPNISPFGFHILSKLQIDNQASSAPKRASPKFKIIGLWKNKKLKIASDVQKSWSFTMEPFKKSCRMNCGRCVEQMKASSQPILYAQPPTMANFHRTWGFITAIMSTIGIIAVIACGVYFLMVFPLGVGTTVLGFMMLAGLLMLFAINFSFITPATVAICTLRRLGMSLAYSIMFSAMLVKVMNTWRLMALKGHRSSAALATARLSSPLGLLFIAGGLVLVQLLVTVTWTVVHPPRPGLYQSLWRCSPPSGHSIVDPETTISLLYVILLMVITCFFSTLTWKSADNNHEPRWIMMSVVGTASVWVGWAFMTTTSLGRGQEPGSYHRDLSTVCANLVSSMIIMVCMYLRKIYIYAKLSKKAKAAERGMKTRLHNGSNGFPTNMYGATRKDSIAGSTASGPTANWEQVANSAKDHLYEADAASVASTASFRVIRKQLGLSATRKPFESDAADDAASTCGSTTSSVQVQGTDLYPMEVYDGGCQFQPLSSLFRTSEAGDREGQPLKNLKLNGNHYGASSTAAHEQDSSFIS